MRVGVGVAGGAGGTSGVFGRSHTHTEMVVSQQTATAHAAKMDETSV